MPKYEIGDEVLLNFENRRVWYKGIVVNINSDYLFIRWIDSSLNNVYTFHVYKTPDMSSYHSAYYLNTEELIILNKKIEEYPDICEWE